MIDTVTLTAPDISCGHCKQCIESALGDVPGVQRVTVDVDIKSVEVRFDSDQTSRVALERRLDAEGYPVAS
jgi:copper chaperone